MMLGDNGDPCICSHCKYDGVAPREDDAEMSDDLIKRLRAWDGSPFDDDASEAADRIEQLNERLTAATDDAKEAEAYAEQLEAKLTKAVAGLRKIADHKHFSRDQGWTQNAEARIASATLAELEKTE
jgi:hypothetical protein